VLTQQGASQPTPTPSRAPDPDLDPRLAGRPPRRGPSGLSTGWPFSVLVLGYPLWWALGVQEFMLPALAVPMIVYLARCRPVRLPRGFWLWMLFLGWMGLGVLVLQVNAPGALPAASSGRIVTLAFRLDWYLSATVAMLYLGNVPREHLPDRRVMRWMAALFVTVSAGGLLGVLAPNFEFRSLMELVLPQSLATNGFIYPMIHPAAAQLQEVLGYVEGRPKAPLAYANSWGATYGLTLPFFIATWFGREASWRRLVAPFILVASLAPVVLSLNRGLWLAVGVMAAFLAVRLAVARKPLALVGILGLTMVLLGAIVASPLGGYVQQRIANPHSNEGRANLTGLTLSSAWHGSPIIGFGSTRNVAGNFNSIAGGATDACAKCQPPAMGTQGHLWFLVFTVGYVGAAFFLSFFLVQLLRGLRNSTALGLVCTSVLVMYFVMMLVYDVLGLPLLVLMTAIALLWRARQDLALSSAPAVHRPTSGASA
jgi:hypothetical protein